MRIVLHCFCNLKLTAPSVIFLICPQSVWSFRHYLFWNLLEDVIAWNMFKLFIFRLFIHSRSVPLSFAVLKTDMCDRAAFSRRALSCKFSWIIGLPGCPQIHGKKTVKPWSSIARLFGWVFSVASGLRSSDVENWTLFFRSHYLRLKFTDKFYRVTCRLVTRGLQIFNVLFLVDFYIFTADFELSDARNGQLISLL